MKILKMLTESNASKAWCISRSGNVVPVRVHPFGALDDDSVEDAAWLYVAASGQCTNSLIGYIANQLCYDYNIGGSWSDEDITDLVQECLNDIECLKGLSGRSSVVTSLINSVIDYLIKLKANASDNTEILANMTEDELETEGLEIKQFLNENYLRVRLGSEYQNYTERKGAVYFRTSSTDGFNWYPVIFKFLDDLSRTTRIGEVTVERDTSATGDRKVYVDHMSFDEFLLQKPIVIESVIKCGTIGRGEGY